MTRVQLPSEMEGTESRKRIPAWALSAILHFMIVIVAALVVRPQSRSAESETSDRTVGIALVKREQQQVKFITESTEDSESNESSSDNSEAIRNSLPQLNQLDESLPGFLPTDTDIGDIGTEMGKDLVGADGFLEGIAKGPKRGGDTGQATTSVFGIQGTGTRFVYVFDRSGSMVDFGGRPLAAAKAQLVASIETLGPNQQFQIIFYNDRPRAFTPRGGRPKMIYATDKNKKLARRFVANMPGGGSTRHLPALKMAVDFAPDVVFFLTDAAQPIISDDNLRVIDRWNRNAASIHAIEFGPENEPVGDNFLKKLARFNGGKYTYQNVTRFKK